MYNEDQFRNHRPVTYQKNNTPIIVAVCVVCLITIIVAAASLIYILDNKEEPPILSVTSCPSIVYAPEGEKTSVVIEGTMRDNNTSCVLKINGKTIETCMDDDVTVHWSATFDLAAGDTEDYVIELKNNDNISVSETKTVYCQLTAAKKQTPVAPTTPLQAGSEFVKKKSGGLNISRYAGTDYEIVDYIARDDYTSKMVFVGDYDVDYEGYTWYRIISPNGKYGYVRSDLVNRVN